MSERRRANVLLAVFLGVAACGHGSAPSMNGAPAPTPAPSASTPTPVPSASPRPLPSGTFTISTDAESSPSLAVGSDGEGWLVSFREVGRRDLVATRLSPEGVVLDDPPILVSDP